MKKLNKNEIKNIRGGMSSTQEGVCAGAFVLGLAAAANLWNPAGWVMAGVAAVSWHCFVTGYEENT